MHLLPGITAERLSQIEESARERIFLIADQIEAWIEQDGLLEAAAFERMAKQDPFSIGDEDLNLLVELWEHGKKFRDSIEARLVPDNIELTEDGQNGEETSDQKREEGLGPKETENA